MEQRNLFIGYDLCEDYSAISCLNPKTFEPESICVGKDETKQLIPTILGIRKDTKEWYFGTEARQKELDGTCIVIKDLLSKVIQKEEVTILGTSISPIALLERFLKKTLLVIKQYYPNNSIKMLVITIKEMNPVLVEGIYKALEGIGIERERAHITSHINSFEYYALSQGKELFMNDVGLFCYDISGLNFYQLSINRMTTPNIVGIKKIDFSHVLSWDMLSNETDLDRLTMIFDNIARSVLHKQVISTIYITGRGFMGTWVDKVLVHLCVGRRVFKGSNLFTRGATYFAKDLLEQIKCKEFLFLSDEMVKSDVSLTGYYNGRVSDIMIIKATQSWYEVNEKLDFILDDEDSITITRTDFMTKHKITEKFKLDGLPKRANKLIRIEIRLHFIKQDTLIVTAKEKGFGDFYPSSNRIWEKEIILG